MIRRLITRVIPTLERTARISHYRGKAGFPRLGTSNSPVFSSRTCRIASILEHRHPLEDPSQPELQRRIVLTEISQPISVASKHMLKPLVWPQAAPFASEALAEAGIATAELGYRLTTHRGQFTQSS